MDKILIIVFPAITFGVVTAGVVLYEATKYLSVTFF